MTKRKSTNKFCKDCTYFRYEYDVEIDYDVGDHQTRVYCVHPDVILALPDSAETCNHFERRRSRMITEEKRDQMNRLYFAAIDLLRAQLRFLDGVSMRTLQELQRFGEVVGNLLTEINNGTDPVRFESKTASLCATAAMIGGAE